MAVSLGLDWQRDLWTSPYRLRFELNQGGPYVSMFTSSYDRARALARAALPTNEVIGVIRGLSRSKTRAWSEVASPKVCNAEGKILLQWRTWGEISPELARQIKAPLWLRLQAPTRHQGKYPPRR